VVIGWERTEDGLRAECYNNQFTQMAAELEGLSLFINCLLLENPDRDLFPKILVIMN